MAEASTTQAPAPQASAAQAGDANHAAAPQSPAQAARMLKLKIDGQEMEMSEAEVIQLAQQGKAANKRFQEAAVTRKQAEDIIKYAQDNPAEFFKRTGKNARQWAEDYLLEQIQHEKMSPEQKKAYENEQRLKKYEASEKAAKEKEHSDRMAALEKQHMESYDTLFVQALTESGLPRTPYTIKRMAELTLVNVKKKLDLAPSQLAKIVREDYISEQKALFGQADGAALLEILGKDAVKRLSKAQLANYKSSKTNNSVTSKAVSSSKDSKPNPVSAWRAMQKKTRSMI